MAAASEVSMDAAVIALCKSELGFFFLVKLTVSYLKNDLSMAKWSHSPC